ncbi:MAG TPA: hypothetical protein DCL44_11425 [Elusimicrobia bacterium]|nr:hypothetical protein [Elusimicrobiota bacterium]
MDIEDILGMPKHKRYIKNTRTSHDRNVRIEINGDVTKAEQNFLNGMSFFIAGTLSKDDEKYTRYVSEVMSKLLKHFVDRMKKPEGK